MRLSAQEFRDLPHKAVTLLGMSGVGKTRLSSQLDRKKWFHYSGDYRIGTHYLGENILDNIKTRIVKEVPFVAELLRSDSIYIANNITIDNLEPVMAYLGKPGNEELGGLPLKEFKIRLQEHHDAEEKAMRDMPDFIRKGQKVYGYPHLINDAGGSLCEMQNPEVYELLAKHTLILYIHADEKHIQKLTDRQQDDPKPLYYPDHFLDQALQDYCLEYDNIEYEQIVPDEFTCWAFPRLLQDRMARYQSIAQQYGYTVSMDETGNVTSGEEFVELIARAIDRADS